MSYNATVLNILIASANDAVSENEIMKDVIYEWNKAYSESKGIVLLPMLSTGHSEDKLLEKSDIIAAAFWTRLSPYIGKNLGDTLDRIDDYVESGKVIMLFFSSQPVAQGSVDPKQYKTFNKFKEVVKADGLFNTYDNLDELKAKFLNELNRCISNYKQLKKESVKPEVKESVEPKKPAIKIPLPKKEVKETSLPKAELDTNKKQNKEDTKAEKLIPNMEEEIIILESYMEESIEPVKPEVKIPSISENASILLKETSRDANTTIVRKSSINGTTIRTNKKDFVINNDKIDIVRWEAAIRELEHKGLVEDRNVSGERYRLTDEGKRVAELIED